MFSPFQTHTLKTHSDWGKHSSYSRSRYFECDVQGADLSESGEVMQNLQRSFSQAAVLCLLPLAFPLSGLTRGAPASNRKRNPGAAVRPLDLDDHLQLAHGTFCRGILIQEQAEPAAFPQRGWRVSCEVYAKPFGAHLPRRGEKKGRSLGWLSWLLLNRSPPTNVKGSPKGRRKTSLPDLSQPAAGASKPHPHLATGANPQQPPSGPEKDDHLPGPSPNSAGPLDLCEELCPPKGDEYPPKRHYVEGGKP